MIYRVPQNGTCQGAFLSYETLFCWEFTVQLTLFHRGASKDWPLACNETWHLLTVLVETRRSLALN
jgi:hypothetical protein